MALAGSTQLSRELGIQNRHGYGNQSKIVMAKGRLHLLSITLSSHASRQDAWSLHLLNSMRGSITPVSSRCERFPCRSFLAPGGGNEIPILKSAALVLTRSCNALQGRPLLLQLVPAVSIVAFATWGLGPLMRLSRNLFLDRTDSSWKKSSSYYVLTYYLQPLLLWIGTMLVCRALDPIILPSKGSQAVKQRLIIFIRSLSSVLASAYCFSGLIQQVQKFFVESNDPSDARNMGFHFVGKAVYTAIWVAAVSLFMELLGFSTQKWLTAGGLGTVFLTLAGREILTNFLSSVMIHATRPFVVNEWIQTKIEGYEVSGTVEHVGWWSPTIIRGDDREAVHIPNHKFTVNVVRNLSQKTHWRIKTHLAISHLDVSNINNIVADMRKVLAKNPQVEQQRLHRRVFLDYINPENQALTILVSCFVKTPHFEEYLCVKEALLLDLLRVVSHHRARLATPIRTVQKAYHEGDMENIPFADGAIFTSSSSAATRPLLIEPSYKINNGDDGSSASVGLPRQTEEKDTKTNASSTSESKLTHNNNEKQVSQERMGDLEGKKGLSPEDNKPLLNFPESGAGKANGAPSATPLTKQDGDRGSKATPALEENIVLGVALEGSKRTLPIEEEAKVQHPESKQLAACQHGNAESQIDTSCS